ncbi:MAG: type II toxin-antitoxin system VapC family toxin [Verrucomicrobiota bacterium]|nr:type II toxin-antitoxin system VapC family toxin [Verrucomicrobiota bacterium]
MIVVDTNVICYRWMASPHAGAVDKLWRKDSDWIVPLLWRSEFRNALAGAVRKELIAMETAIDIIDQAEAQFAEREFVVASRAVMELVGQSRCSAYDCEFVALALEQRVPLVTFDGDVLRDFGAIGLKVEEFLRRKKS